VTATQFFVPGLPAPKGSTRAFLNRYTGRVAVVADNRASQKAWQSSVSSLALLRFRRPTVGPAMLILTFSMPRPKSLPKGQFFHLKKPDLDKLTRCVLDGLTGIVYRDDSQVTALATRKRYVRAGEMTGCKIEVEA
jgi:Holliday junction resolvase RusA-like endonuclease